MFEIVDNDNRWVPNHGYTISSPGLSLRFVVVVV